MRLKRHRMNGIIFAFFVLSQIPVCIHGCILLLNGWTPISVFERTALADVVVSGYVHETYKNQRSPALTYSAKVELITIYKGHHLVEQLRPVNKNTFVISNFGDKKMCYADVSEDEIYIFFLTVYKKRLSAKYDDIFGAATELTKSKEDEIYRQLGWNIWSSWESCSASCNGGLQIRRRHCSKTDGVCNGTDSERRYCNKFSCKGAKDLISIFGIDMLPVGVSRDVNRTSAYDIVSNANLYTPLSNVFRNKFPNDFSILMTAKFNFSSNGYLLTVSDIMGNQRIAIKYGKKLILEYYDQNNLPGRKSPGFTENLSDSSWHQFSISVQNQALTLYIDCKKVKTKYFGRSAMPYIGVNLMLSLGPYFARHGRPFQGSLEQLTIISDPSAASQQCSTEPVDVKIVNEQAVKDDGHIETIKETTDAKKLKRIPSTSVPPVKITSITTSSGAALDWSSWSSCSATCGKGTQSRTLYCGDNDLSNCLEKRNEIIQSRPCLLSKCGDCETFCQNGGKCRKNGRCKCKLGYTGKYCQEAICKRPCRNGGKCIKPGICSCPYGYLKPFCKPVCSVKCYNGGRCWKRTQCKCRKGYSGKDCSIPKCRRGCSNGGRCVAPNRCSCRPDYRGRRCQRALCTPKCKNGGFCMYPHICKCKKGFYGTHCEKYKCKRQCRNGGFCVGPNKCKCQTGYTGKWCHKGRCNHPCLNGGRCKNDRCRCPSGWTGKRCVVRGCNYERYSVPYERSYKRMYREEYITKCGPWSWKTCVKTRVKYELVSKTMYRTAYRCV